MDGSAGRSGRGQPVERFKPTNGLLAGWSGLALAGVVIGYVALNEHSVVGLRLGLAAAFMGALVWTTQLRPRVTAYPEVLVIHGPVSDVTVPYAAVSEVTMGQTLNVWSGGRRYVCVGIGKSIGFDTRQKMRAHGSGGLLGANRVTQISGRPEVGPSRNLDVTYQTFVLDRIHDLVAAARPRRQDAAPEAPRAHRAWALPELAVLVATGLALVVSILAL